MSYWDQIEGNWKQLVGKVKEEWSELTDDDLAAIGGKREQLEGKLQERYGVTVEEVKKQIDDFFSRL
jgi:uncharacterized protein YjbJ (UPF0337 family)